MNKFIIKKINELKNKKNAIILSHNYQPPEIQEIADFSGDSLELSIKASSAQAKIIVFCGVKFMAETASILCPDKMVLIPDPSAGCPMADMVNKYELKKIKEQNPDMLILSYVNTTAEVKAISNICCTSANAVKVVEKLNRKKKILFLPDKHLGEYVISKTARKMFLWDGYCPIHVKILAEDIKRMKKLHPLAKIIAHPECTKEVLSLANAVLSTSKMCSWVKESSASEIIVATEIGLIHRLKKENPDKKFYPASPNAICPDMKLTTLEKVLETLEKTKNEVKVPAKVQKKALIPIQKMLSIA